MNRTIHDTISEKVGHRMSVHKEGKNGDTIVPYSSGHELTWTKTREGDGKRLKEVRTLTKIKTPHTLYVSGFGPGTLRKNWKEDQNG